jgi:hypothetical protein
MKAVYLPANSKPVRNRPSHWIQFSERDYAKLKYWTIYQTRMGKYVAQFSHDIRRDLASMAEDPVNPYRLTVEVGHGAADEHLPTGHKSPVPPLVARRDPQRAAQ